MSSLANGTLTTKQHISKKRRPTQRSRPSPKQGSTSVNQHPRAGEGRRSNDGLRVEVDDQIRRLSSKELRNGEFIKKLIADCQEANQVTFGLDSLLAVSNEDRWLVLDLIASLQPGCSIQAGGGEHDDLLQAVLALKVDAKDFGRLKKLQLAALEAAVLVHADALLLACNEILKALRARGVKGLKVDAVVADARKIQKKVFHRNDAADPQQRFVAEVLASAPVASHIVEPAGWVLSDDGIAREQEEGLEIEIPAPVVITSRCLRINGDTELLKLAWARNGKWQEQVVERAMAADSRKLLEMADYGMPVNSNNAKSLVQYLADFEAENLARLPVIYVTKKLGFQGKDGCDGFLLGNKLIAAEAEDEEEFHRVEFRGADEGDEQIVEGFHATGKYQGWLKAVEPLAPFPRARLAIYASLAAIMLAVYRTRNFIVDYSGETTTGKTSCLRVAASCWGNPDEASSHGANSASALTTWDSTRVFRERAPAVLNNLPFVIDDTKRAKNRDEVAQTIYDITQGRGRGRGTVLGLARQETWSTVTLTSGEQPITSFSEDGGTRARVLSLWGSPFETTDADMGKLVRRINERIRIHYGHAGPQFVEYVLHNRDAWPKWREQFKATVHKFEDQAGDHPVAGRMAEHFAAIHCTAELAHEAIELPWEFQAPIDPLWDELVGEAGEADRALAALRHVVSWAYANEQSFEGRRCSTSAGAPSQGWAGKWMTGDELPGPRGDWKVISFYPHRIEQILREGGFESDPIIRTWRDRGWLLTTEEAGKGRSRQKVKIQGKPEWMISITREAVKRANPEAAEAKDEQ